MLASIPSIMATALSIISGYQQAKQLGKDLEPWYELMKELFGGKKITVEELAAIRAKNDALNAEIEALPEGD